MRKQTSFLFACLFLLSTFPFVTIGCVKADSQPIRVPSPDYPTIQSAIEGAFPGSTILISSGIYIENLTINKNLVLIGEDRGTTIIDGNDTDTVISIVANDVTIEDLTVTKRVARAFDTGVRVDHANRILMDKIEVINTYTGLAFYSSTSSDLLDSIIVNNTIGMVFLYSNYNLFSNNTFTGNMQAISLYYSGSNTFVGNTLVGNTEGIFLSSSSNRNYFYHNNFEDEIPVASGAVNIWSRGNEGNYWANYNFTGQDLNGDGIGIEPYRIDENNMDNYPLMGTFAEYDIDFEGLTYYVTVISNSTISDVRFEIGQETGNKIVNFKATGQSDTTGFCRIMIPTSLMSPPFTVTDSAGAVSASLLNISDQTNSYLYFSYPNDNLTLSVIYSAELQLYDELLDRYVKLQADFLSLNSTYQNMLTNYTITYQTLLNDINALLANFAGLQGDFLSLNSSLQQSLLNQSENAQNFRSLTYVFAALTAAFLITTVYLTSRLYGTSKPKIHHDEEEV